MGKKLGSNLEDWFWFRVSREIEVMILAGLLSSEGLSEAEGCFQKGSHRGQVDSGDW